MTDGIADVLDDVRRGLRRLWPIEALRAATLDGVIVDIRPQADREAEGEIPGALVVERNVLEWRFDPTSPDRLPVAAYDTHVVLVCNEGYASSLAAAALQALGVHRATDVVGGYRAWRAAGLPTTNPMRGTS